MCTVTGIEKSGEGCELSIFSNRWASRILVLTVMQYPRWTMEDGAYTMTGELF